MCLFVTIALSKCFGVAITLEKYAVYQQMQDALIHGNTSSIHNLDILADVFFPKGGLEPVCVPITYNLVCSDNESMYDANNLEDDIRYSFLWTQNYITFSTGVLLLSYSGSGITLKGFEWENSCIFMNETMLILEVSSLNCSSDIVDDSLQDLSSQVYSYQPELIKRQIYGYQVW